MYIAQCAMYTMNGMAKDHGRNHRLSEISQWVRGSTDLVILAFLRDQPMHGYQLFVVLREAGHPEFQLQLGTLYPLLRRLERAGWITGHWEEGSQHRRRKIYRLSKPGRDILDIRLSQWQRLTGTVNALLEHARRGK